jgi:6-phosphogluconolactonase
MNKILVLLLFFLHSFHGLMAQKHFLLVGTYTQKGSEGVYIYRFDAKQGTLEAVNVAKSLVNPSFLAVSPNQKFVYVVEETANGKINAFQLNEETGQLTLLNSQKVSGDYPCHVAVDKTGKWVLAGNYGSGNFSIFPVQADGSLGSASQTVQHEGKSINTNRQEAPHVHSINIGKNNQDVFVLDLGIDKIMAYQLDSKTGKIASAKPPFVEIKAGAGPRHFAFHPKKEYAYAILELTSEIATFSYKASTLVPLQTISTLPTDYKAENSCADIHISPDGKFLYGSNRGHNSIALYSIHPKTGKLSLVQHQPVMGEMPRNFAIDPSGNFVLVANQKSDNLTIFKRDKKTGILTYTGKEIKVSMPVCLKFR